MDTGSGTIPVRDILDLMAPEDQAWIDDTFSEDENKEIIKAIVQPRLATLPNLLVLARSVC